MEEYSKKAREEFLKGKKIKRYVPDLRPKELIVFAQLLAESASLGEFNLKLGLSFDDVELQKKRTGLTDIDQAKNFLRSLANVDDMDSLKEEVQRIKERKSSIIKFKEQEEHINTDKPYNKKVMQTKLDDIQTSDGLEDYQAPDSDTYKPIEKHTTNFQVSVKNEDKFKDDALKFGINFLIDKWGAEREEIISELKRLNISLEKLKR